MIKNELKNNGITLIALVITIIVILILAGVAIASLTGENGLLNRAVSAKNNTILSEAREKIKLAGMDSYIEGNGLITYESLINALNKNFKGNGTEVDYYQIIEGDNTTTSWKVRAYTSVGEVDEIISSKTAPSTNYEWKIVADNDNSGTISFGDEVAPLKDDVQNEHFYIVDISGSKISLLAKLSVDTTSNSQSTNAQSVTFDEIYDTGSEGIQCKMKPGDEKGGHFVEVYDSEDPSIVVDRWWSAEVYGPNEIGTLISEGRCARNYEQRFLDAGLNLIDVRKPRTQNGTFDLGLVRAHFA